MSSFLKQIQSDHISPYGWIKLAMTKTPLLQLAEGTPLQMPQEQEAFSHCWRLAFHQKSQRRFSRQTINNLNGCGWPRIL